jgi:hypothetical protein
MTALMLAGTAIRWCAQGFDYRSDMVRNTHELRTELGEQSPHSAESATEQARGRQCDAAG